MRNVTNFLLFLIISGFISCDDCRNASSSYQLVWDTPSRNTYETMPLGNGEVAANAWIDEAGDLRFYISRIDAIDENGQLLKVGALRISPERPVTAQAGFKQTLDVKRGLLEAVYGDLSYKLWIDANRNVIVAEITTKTPQTVTVFNDGWRNERTRYDSYECSDLYNRCSYDETSIREAYRERFDNLETVIEPDVIPDLPDAIGWYHRNVHSKPYQVTAEVQGTDDLLPQDPLLHRTFGAIVQAERGKKTDAKTLLSPAGKTHRFEIAVHAKHPATAQEWLRETEQLLADAQKLSPQKRFDEHAKWWDDFCNRSWIHLSQPDAGTTAPDSSDAFVLSRAYLLQRYVSACAGRGTLAMKFNGSIFTVPEPGQQGDADYRRWGPGYWWQNTRLPYFSMPAAGDFDLMQPFFNQYFEMLPLCSNRVKKYFGHDGAYYPECVYFWGDVFLETYGWESWKERTDKLQKSGYHKYEWVSGLELACMMLEYYEYTEDAVFLNTKTIPLTLEVLTFFNEHYTIDTTEGKLFMSPSQALETWWDCDNPMPELAGMYAVIERLERLPENALTAERKKFVSELKRKLPELPLTKSPDDKMMLAPAQRFEQKRNVENPELYAVFPFRLISYEKPNVEWGIEAFKHRKDRGAFGWRQDDIFASYLGLTDEARDHLVQRARNKHEASRFPVFWGPNYDWIPDQDHGGILTKGVQSLVMQCDGRRIDLFPAFPTDWDCDFKLRAPYNTTVEGTLKNGKLTRLKVVPEDRRKDVVIWDKRIK